MSLRAVRSKHGQDCDSNRLEMICTVREVKAHAELSDVRMRHGAPKEAAGAAVAAVQSLGDIDIGWR